MKDSLDILVVEDTPINQESARFTLKDHNLTVADSYSDANNKLFCGDLVFDAVLTDLMIPYRRGDGLDAYGFPIAFTALGHGIPYIGIFTDTNHHDDHLVYGGENIMIPTPERYSETGIRRVLSTRKNPGLDEVSLNTSNSVFMFLDINGGRNIFPLKDGTFTEISPYKVSEEERQLYIMKDCGEPIYAKNWGKALELLMSKRR